MNIKKIIMLSICIFLLLILSACDPMMIHLDNSDLENKITKVELIHYDNPKQKKFASWIPDHSNQLKPFDFENVTILQELPSEYNSPFIEELCKAYVRDKYYIFNAPKGICLRLTNNDGSFMIYYCDNTCRGYVGLYSQDGEVLDYYGSPDSYKDYANLINNYFDNHIGV